MRVRYGIEILASNDDDEKEICFSRTDPTDIETIVTDYDFSMQGTVELPAETEDQEIPLGNITKINCLYLETDQEIKVRFDDIEDAYITVAEDGRIFMQGEWTEITLSNPASDAFAATVTYFIAGTAD